MGYGGTNTINNLGSVYIIMVAYFILLLVIFAQWGLMKKKQSILDPAAVEGGENEIISPNGTRPPTLL